MKKGKPKGSIKTGGRTKGTPNKITADHRTFIDSLLTNKRDLFIKDLEQLESHQRVSIYEKLLTYVLPKQQAVAASIDFENLSEAQIDMIINQLTKDISI